MLVHSGQYLLKKYAGGIEKIFGGSAEIYAGGDIYLGDNHLGAQRK